ncbi:interferon-induced protein 44-like [Carassius gibelio]|uniref:interferon-induced protein 44-like n=1 Tax=Carassius gibelio TaxID=101364 RepID=UPI002278EC19|nr:interferon-induced protein 44-like [Carassius gibelio]
MFNPVQLPSNAELDKQWRRFDWGQKKYIKEKLENFCPSHPDVKDIKILVTGPVGGGKSSFINSVDSASLGRISSRALVDSDICGPVFTQKLKGFPIRSEKKRLPFILKDVMGLLSEAFEGPQPEDIINAVFGHVKDGYKFNEKQPLNFKDQQFNCDPKLSDQSFCLVYVISAITVQYTDDRLIDKMKLIRQRISEKGIPQVVIMTQVDNACLLVNNDLRKVYSSKNIKEKMELCSAKLGVPLTNIFPVKNYHNEIDTEDDIDVLILKAFEQIVQLADDRLKDSENY